jgi:hypothetical protein
MLERCLSPGTSPALRRHCTAIGTGDGAPTRPQEDGRAKSTPECRSDTNLSLVHLSTSLLLAHATLVPGCATDATNVNSRLGSGTGAASTEHGSRSPHWNLGPTCPAKGIPPRPTDSRQSYRSTPYVVLICHPLSIKWAAAQSGPAATVTLSGPDAIHSKGRIAHRRKVPRLICFY